MHAKLKTLVVTFSCASMIALACKKPEGNRLRDVANAGKNVSLTLGQSSLTAKSDNVAVKLKKWEALRQSVDLAGHITTPAEAKKFFPLNPDSAAKPRFNFRVTISESDTESICTAREPSPLNGQVALSCVGNTDLLSALKTLCKKLDLDSKGQVATYVETDNTSCSCKKAATGAVRYELFLGKPQDFEVACRNAAPPTESVPDAPDVLAATQHLSDLCKILAKAECNGLKSCGVGANRCLCPSGRTIPFADYINHPIAFVDQCSKISGGATSQDLQKRLEALRNTCIAVTKGMSVSITGTTTNPVCHCLAEGGKDIALNEWLDKPASAFETACRGD